MGFVQSREFPETKALRKMKFHSCSKETKVVFCSKANYVKNKLSVFFFFSPLSLSFPYIKW
jgi:hypothetical protein